MYARPRIRVEHAASPRFEWQYWSPSILFWNGPGVREILVTLFRQLLGRHYLKYRNVLMDPIHGTGRLKAIRQLILWQ
jgi:hypothetical protein